MGTPQPAFGSHPWGTRRRHDSGPTSTEGYVGGARPSPPSRHRVRPRPWFSVRCSQWIGHRSVVPRVAPWRAAGRAARRRPRFGQGTDRGGHRRRRRGVHQATRSDDRGRFTLGKLARRRRSSFCVRRLGLRAEHTSQNSVGAGNDSISVVLNELPEVMSAITVSAGREASAARYRGLLLPARSRARHVLHA